MIRMGTCQRLHPKAIDPEVFFRPKLKIITFETLKVLATLHRIFRNDKPRGVLPQTLDARPKTRGLMPRHEWLLDG